MKKNNKLIITIMMLALMALMTGVIFAFFYQTESINNTFTFGNAEISLTLFQIQGFTFQNAGDTQSTTLKVKNDGSSFLKYHFGIEIEESTGLENMLMVYFDNQFVGMLSSLCNGGNEYLFEGNNYLYIDEEKEHTLRLELHIGAEGYHSGKTLKLKINAYARTLDVNEVTFVSNKDEFIQAIYSVNGGLTGREIKLANNITLTEDLSINNDATIDLYGNNLILDDADIVITSGKTILKNTKSSPNHIITGNGEIVLNGATALLLLENNTEQYVNSVKLELYDYLSAEVEVIEKITHRLKNGLSFGDTDIFKNEIIYYDLFNTINDDYCSFSAGTLTAPALTASKISALTLETANDTYTIEYKIRASGLESIFDDIVDNHLAYLNSLEEEDIIANDIFLPNRLKGYNCYIEWWSSAPEILSIKGKYTPSLADSEVTLIAFVRIDGSVFSKTFKFKTAGVSYEMRFNYFLTRFKDLIFYSTNDPEYLSVVNQESPHHYTELTDGRDLGFIDITYSLDLQFDFLTLDNNAKTLMLNRITYMKFAQLNVTIEFEESQFFSGIVAVRIELEEAAFIPEVFAYIESQFEIRGNVLQNIYQTGYGDFPMPKEHLSLDIIYTIINDYPEGEEPAIVSGVSNPEEEEATFEIRPSYFNIFDQYVTVRVEVLGVPRIMEFTLPAAIHNNVEGFESANVFERVQNQLQASNSYENYIITEHNFIPIDFIRNSSLYELNLSSNQLLGNLNLEGSVAGLAYFDSLLALNVSGNAQYSPCTTSQSASQLIRAISRLTHLKELNISYINLDNISYIKFLVNLESLNLKGNSGISIFNEILYLNKLSYLNISNTGYHTTYSLPLLELAYFTYRDANSNVPPQFYYTDNANPGIDTLFVPAPANDNANYIAGLRYLYNLTEIPEIRVVQTQLVTQIVDTDEESELITFPITWALEQSPPAPYQNALTVTTTAPIQLIRSQTPPAYDIIAVVKATINVNGQLVTRYFYARIKGA